ncbi:uncharacterized protein LOC101851731, partial [Aplysia californica]|uniref:Uncharacterized protein LOC101851731 n=1 Tax=Aplysia californica TaxID=6500 RepID=A0ABM0ZZF0_APLCA
MESHPYPGIMRVFLCQLICLIVVPTLCLGYVDMYVSPYPARVYQQAPADLAVARVRASDNETGQPVTSFRLESRNDARYFKVGSDGVIRTKTTISFKVGRIFQFFVFAYGTNQTCEDENCDVKASNDSYKHVKIEVSAKNEYAPRFLNQTYTFPVYRYGVADVIGKVTVEDDDVEDYNRHFSIFAQPGQEDFKYISLESDGVLRLSQPVPDEIDTLNVKLLAVDTGSPQRSGTTDVIVDVILVKQPETFCFSTTATTTTLCWKNPMPERAFDGYTVTVTGDSRRGDFLPYIDGHEEYCYPLNGTKVGEQYIFRVSVQSDDLWYGEEFDIVFNKSGIGYSRDCVEREFS